MNLSFKQLGIVFLILTGFYITFLLANVWGLAFPKEDFTRISFSYAILSGFMGVLAVVIHCKSDFRNRESGEKLIGLTHLFLSLSSLMATLSFLGVWEFILISGEIWVKLWVSYIALAVMIVVSGLVISSQHKPKVADGNDLID